VLENLVASTEHRGIVVHLSPCPKLQMPHLRLVIRVLSDEVHTFFKENFLSETLDAWRMADAELAEDFVEE